MSAHTGLALSAVPSLGGSCPTKPDELGRPIFHSPETVPESDASRYPILISVYLAVKPVAAKLIRIAVNRGLDHDPARRPPFGRNPVERKTVAVGDQKIRNRPGRNDVYIVVERNQETLRKGRCPAPAGRAAPKHGTCCHRLVAGAGENPAAR